MASSLNSGRMRMLSLWTMTGSSGLRFLRRLLFGLGFVGDTRGEHRLVEVAQRTFARAVVLEHARFELAHLAGDLADRGVDGRVHVVGLGGGLDGDVVGAVEDDLGDVPVVLDVEDDFGLNDLRVV